MYEGPVRVYLHTPPSTNLNKLLLSWLLRACICIFVSLFFFSYLTLAGVKTDECNSFLRLQLYVSLHIRLNHFILNELANNVSRLRFVLLLLTMIGCAVNVHCKERLTSLINDKLAHEISSQKIKARQPWQFNFSYTKESFLIQHVK